MHHLNRIEWLRLWLEQNAAIGGLLLAVVLVLILGALGSPRRFGQPVDGQIVKFVVWPSGKGSSLAAVVRLRNGEVTAPVSLSDGCRIGGPIHLITPEFLWGRSYRAAAIPCSAEAQQ